MTNTPAMGNEDGRFEAALDEQSMHDLREGLTLTKGWLEAVFRAWEKLGDDHKREMVAAALLGANQMAFLIEKLEGRNPDEIQLPHERMAEEFLRLVDLESISADE
jgi:hypothetical protein